MNSGSASTQHFSVSKGNRSEICGGDDVERAWEAVPLPVVRVVGHFAKFPRPEALRGHHAESDGGPARSDVWQDAKLYRMIIPGHAQRKQPGARQENSVRPRSSDLRDSGASAGRCRSRTSGSARESGVWA